MRSALYEGRLVHTRHAGPATGGVAHTFSQRVTMLLVALDEWEELAARHPLYSSTRWAPVRLDRADHLGDPAAPLDTTVRDLVESRLGRRPTGRILLLTTPRVWGWHFNPLSVFYCLDGTGALEAIVLEVTSTPWHERTAYVVEAGAQPVRFDKEMHVSPFLPSDLEYVLRAGEPGESLHLHLANRRGDERVFDASLSLQRVGNARADLARLVWRRPLAAVSVSWGIYRQALRLWRKGAPFVPRRARAAHPVTAGRR